MVHCWSSFTLIEGTPRGSFPHDQQPVAKKRHTQMAIDDSEMLPEYDFGSMGAPAKGNHLAKYKQYVRTIELNEELAKRFPDERSVLIALAAYAAEHPDPTERR